MNAHLKGQMLRYWLAMNASAFDAAVHSSVAFFGVAGAHAAFDAVPALNLQQFAAVFLITFGRATLTYLDQHPLAGLMPGNEDALDRLNAELAKGKPAPAASQAQTI